MAEFVWRAAQASGQVVDGRLEAPSLAQALRQLRADMSELMTAALDAGNQAISDTSTQYVISGEKNLLDVIMARLHAKEASGELKGPGLTPAEAALV